MNRRDFLKKVTAGAAGAAGLMGMGALACNSKRRKPNILIIVTDDQGYADLSAYPHHAPDIETPNMDRLAKEGVLCYQAYVSAPVCSPSRTGWNTGLYQQRWDPKASWGPGLPGKVKTVAEYLKEAGYITGKVGKNDYGQGYHKQDVREYPLNHGYDEFLGFSAHAHDYFLLSEEIEKKTPDPYGSSAALGRLFDNSGKKSFEEGYTTEIFTDWAIDFLDNHKEEPFFLNVAYNSVHHLIHEVPKKYLDKFGAKPIPNYDPETMGNYKDYYNTYNQLDPISDEEMRKYYLANLNCLDDNIGRLLDRLDDLGLTENTLVIFFGDNGGSPLTGANNRPLRGGKYIMFEGGLRVPVMLRWPGYFKAGGEYRYPFSTLDILPSVCEAAGLPQPEPRDGESFLTAVKENKPAPGGTKPLFWKFQINWAVRDGDWKLVKTRDQQRRQPTSQILGGPPTNEEPALFNLRDDPSEQNNVIAEHPEVAARLQKLYDEWWQEMQNSQETLRPKIESTT